MLRRRASAGLIVVVLILVGGVVVFRRPIKRLLRPPSPHHGGLFWDPEGLAVDPEGNIYVADEKFGTITVLSPEGAVLARFRSRILHGDSLVARGRDRVITIGEHELWVLDLSADPPRSLRQIARRGPGPGEFEDPEGIHEDPQTGDLYVTDEDHRRVQVFDREGTFQRTFPVPDDPESVCVAPDGRVFVTFSKANYVQVFSKTGAPGPRFGDDLLRNPDCVRIGPDGDIYVTDQKNHRIQVFDRDLKPLRAIGRHGSGPGEFDTPEDIAFDPQGRLVVADSGNQRVQILTQDGTFVREMR